jgi:hypothetical protein
VAGLASVHVGSSALVVADPSAVRITMSYRVAAFPDRLLLLRLRVRVVIASRIHVAVDEMRVLVVVKLVIWRLE